MNDILRDHLDLTAIGILNDVIIFSEDTYLHVQRVRSILQILRDNRLYAKVEKCEFDKDHMTFVGYMVSKSGKGMDPAKVSAILEWPVPKSVLDPTSGDDSSNSWASVQTGLQPSIRRRTARRSA